MKLVPDSPVRHRQSEQGLYDTGLIIEAAHFVDRIGRKHLDQLTSVLRTFQNEVPKITGKGTVMQTRAYYWSTGNSRSSYQIGQVCMGYMGS